MAADPKTPRPRRIGLVVMAILMLILGGASCGLSVLGAFSDSILSAVCRQNRESWDAGRWSRFEKEIDAWRSSGSRHTDPVLQDIAAVPYLRLPLDEYAKRPLWTGFRRGMFARLLFSIVAVVASICILFGKDRARTVLLVSAVSIVAVTAYEAMLLRREAAAVIDDLRRDQVIAHLEFVNRVDLEEEFPAPLQPLELFDRELTLNWAFFYFFVLAGIWQLSALLLACTRQKLTPNR